MYYLEVREILMATFYEFKKMVGKIFGKHIVEENYMIELMRNYLKS